MCSGFKCAAQHHYVLINDVSSEMSRVTLSLCCCGSSSCQPSYCVSLQPHSHSPGSLHCYSLPVHQMSSDVYTCPSQLTPPSTSSPVSLQYITGPFPLIPWQTVCSHSLYLGPVVVSSHPTTWHHLLYIYHEDHLMTPIALSPTKDCIIITSWLIVFLRLSSPGWSECLETKLHHYHFLSELDDHNNQHWCEPADLSFTGRMNLEVVPAADCVTSCCLRTSAAKYTKTVAAESIRNTVWV